MRILSLLSASGFTAGLFTGFWIFCRETSETKKWLRRQIKNFSFDDDTWYKKKLKVIKTVRFDDDNDDDGHRDIH